MINQEEIKKAYTKFEEEDYVGARAILSREINNHKAEWLEKKLGVDLSDMKYNPPKED